MKKVPSVRWILIFFEIFSKTSNFPGKNLFFRNLDDLGIVHAEAKYLKLEKCNANDRQKILAIYANCLMF